MRQGEGPSANGWSMKSATARSYLRLFWVLAALGLIADQASKYGIFAWLYSDGKPQEDEVALGTFPLVSHHRPDPQPREPYATRELKLVSGTFDIVASHTDQREEGTGLAATLRTISGPNLPFVNRGALFGWGGGRSDGQDLNMWFA